MLKHKSLLIVVLGMLLFSALIYSTITSPHASAASSSFSPQTALAVPDAIRRPPATSYAQGYRDGYRTGYQDGLNDCYSRHYYYRSHRFNPGQYNNGFQAGYPYGYQNGTNACKREKNGKQVY